MPWPRPLDYESPMVVVQGRCGSLSARNSCSRHLEKSGEEIASTRLARKGGGRGEGKEGGREGGRKREF